MDEFLAICCRSFESNSVLFYFFNINSLQCMHKLTFATTTIPQQCQKIATKARFSFARRAVSQTQLASLRASNVNSQSNAQCLISLVICKMSASPIHKYIDTLIYIIVTLIILDTKPSLINIVYMRRTLYQCATYSDTI